jgi:tRNA-specific 2-thiouridylase
VAERADGRIRPGRIVDESGRAVGTHEGIHRFTVGQRRGLGVALGRPAFVTGIDAQTATVTVGSEEALLAQIALVADVSLAEGVSLPARARVRVRYRHEGDDALVEPAERRGGETAHRIVFDRPVRAVTSGQVAVMYDGDRVIGGGRIVRASASALATT